MLDSTIKITTVNTEYTEEDRDLVSANLYFVMAVFDTIRF
jgi:hypothetical protein